MGSFTNSRSSGLAWIFLNEPRRHRDSSRLDRAADSLLTAPFAVKRELSCSYTSITGLFPVDSKQCCICLVTLTQEPRRCRQSPNRIFRKLQSLRPGPQCHSAPRAQYRARDTNLVRKPSATQNLTVPSTYSS